VQDLRDANGSDTFSGREDEMTMARSDRASDVDVKHRFSERQKMLADPALAKQAAETIRQFLARGETDALRSFLKQHFPPDVADAMSLLDNLQSRTVFDLLATEEAADVIDEIHGSQRDALVQGTPPARLAKIVEALPADEGTDLVQSMKPEEIETVLAQIAGPKAQDIRKLLAYPKESAGGIATLGYVAVLESDTLDQTRKAFLQSEDAEPLFDIFVIDKTGALKGMLNLRQLLSADPQQTAGSVMSTVTASVPPDMDREQVSRIFARYDLTSLPVVEPLPGGRLIGVITADDVIDVVIDEDTEDTLRMAGSDAAEMEKRSPLRTALLRLPWIMATMFIELGAGLVIHFYDQTLAHVLLLASFMPIISAISGNTGLQSATIIVRGLSTGQIQASEWKRALLRQLAMTMFLGAATGVVLGVIGSVWYGKWTFGLVVAVGMFAAVNIAGIVGTIVPLTSKHLGFDPAITSGPFETAFQDVVGISIFLSLATVLIRFLI
jgi:magnesium transporter